MPLALILPAVERIGQRNLRDHPRRCPLATLVQPISTWVGKPRCLVTCLHLLTML